MSHSLDPAQIDVIAPNFKRRLSGVTATIARLVPLQARQIAIAATGRGLPDHVPQIRLRDVITMKRNGPHGARIWHARRNVEMLGGLALKHLLGKRLTLIFTSASQRRHTGYTRWLIGQMDHIIATSARSAAYLTRPCDVILHGIDLDGFSTPPDRARLKAELGLGQGPVFGCFGRIRPSKGTDIFVDAMIDLLRDHPEAQAVILGRATDKFQSFDADLRARVAASGLGARFHFMAEVPVDQVARYYQALDVFIAPQRWEGFGLTPLEAMACGVPVIAARTGAFDEMITTGENGYLVEIGDQAAITDHCRALLAAPHNITAMGQKARATVVDRFSITREADDLIALYRRLLTKA